MEKDRTGTISTVTLTESANWQGELNPWWWNGSGCSAFGTLYAN